MPRRRCSSGASAYRRARAGLLLGRFFGSKAFLLDRLVASWDEIHGPPNRPSDAYVLGVYSVSDRPRRIEAIAGRGNQGADGLP